VLQCVSLKLAHHVCITIRPTSAAGRTGHSHSDRSGVSGGTFLGDRRLKPAPGVRRPMSGLHPPFVHLVVAAVEGTRRFAVTWCTFHPIFILVLCAPPGAYFFCHHQGGSHAEWPKHRHEHAPTQIGGVICSPVKAVDTECRPPPVARVSKRPKKLRAISCASPGGSPVRECRCGGELLPTRRTLFQIDVLEPRSDVENVAVIPDAATGPRQLVKKHAFLNKFDDVALFKFSIRGESSITRSPTVSVRYSAPRKLAWMPPRLSLPRSNA
jgi:hypothetical protein